MGATKERSFIYVNIMPMVYMVLVIGGLCLGSFVNALVWRLHQKEINLKKSKTEIDTTDSRYSIINGRSMCPNCLKRLSAPDLIPVLSWLILRGRCRYCKQPISYQYPLVEIALAGLFVFSYLFWPTGIYNYEVAIFVLWLLDLTGLMALIIYDLKWLRLPSRIIYPLLVITTPMAVLRIIYSDSSIKTLTGTVLGAAIGGGVFYVIYQISRGKWIGGGDVRLGWLLGLMAGTAARAGILIFIASLIGSLVSAGLISARRLRAKSLIPFGPFLIISIIIVQLFGQDLLNWYQRIFS